MHSLDAGTTRAKLWARFYISPALLQDLVRIKGIPQAVADVVDRNDRQEDHEAGENRQPGIADEVFLGIAEQIAPTGGGRLDAEAEEAQARFLDDGVSQLERGFDDDRANRIGQNVAE